ncbi:unnamed protein product [Aspergillus oryzae]|uniref:Unnamed protein product n=1 Tax=Aspergillus oryzae TaxID=5062 RepID=A0AAN4YU55_ASPOZ|nr:unnamed protein product [Aspergillus oryzae]
MSTRDILHHEYTVACICALSIELAAVTALLDDVHSPLPQSDIDSNTYTLGSMSGHNIVIVCLQSGVCGTTSAAFSVAHMRRTFPSIRFGLMVGVGGGAPLSGADVRLGDVVVSMPTEKYGGVIQYDYGKMCYGHLEPMGLLNKPSPLLLTVLSKMRSSYLLPETKTKQIVSDALQEHQATRHFSRPNKDWLFHAMYEHPRGNPDCSSCDKSQLVSREPRASDEPHIHYGLIVSGNQVMKDARARDSIAKDLHALCFEMEAAGIMDQLSCLVIRGICDYCDSHKQNDWQGYAALAAAAYTKALLSLVPLVKDTVCQEKGMLFLGICLSPASY